MYFDKTIQSLDDSALDGVEKRFLSLSQTQVVGKKLRFRNVHTVSHPRILYCRRLSTKISKAVAHPKYFYFTSVDFPFLGERGEREREEEKTQWREVGKDMVM